MSEPLTHTADVTDNPVGARTDVGCVRDHNEDSFIVLPPLYAVADGMGGHAAGEIASELATQTLAATMAHSLDPHVFVEAVSLANKAIIHATASGDGKPGMGTTLTAALLHGSDLIIAQVGDSRAYHLRASRLRQITTDHSYVAELVASGQLSPEEAVVHPRRSIITRALGSDVATQPDLFTVPLAIGDRILLCSDGLTSMVSDEEIRDILLTTRDPQEATDKLVQSACTAGGLDNITAIVLDIAVLDENVNQDASRASGIAGIPFKGAHNRLPQHAAARKKRSLRLGIISFALLFVLLVGGAIGGVFLYAHNVAFLRIEDDYVSVYRGLNGEVFPGLRLEWFEYQTDIQSSSLTPNLVQRLESGVPVASLDAAKELVADYEEQAAARDAHSESSAS